MMSRILSRSHKLHGGRRHSELALGILLLALGVGGTFYVRNRSNVEMVRVVAVTSPHFVGDVLTTDAVEISEISKESASRFIAAKDIAKVDGMTVVEAITVPGPLPSSAVSSSPSDVVPARDQTLTAVALKPGSFPPSIAAGSVVRVVSVGGINPSDNEIRIFQGDPVVHDISAVNDGTSERIITLIGDVTLGDFIARAGSIRISIVSAQQ